MKETGMGCACSTHWREGKERKANRRLKEKRKERRREIGSYSHYSVKTRGKYTICMFEIGG